MGGSQTRRLTVQHQRRAVELAVSSLPQIALRVGGRRACTSFADVRPQSMCSPGALVSERFPIARRGGASGRLGLLGWIFFAWQVFTRQRETVSPNRARFLGSGPARFDCK